MGLNSTSYSNSHNQMSIKPQVSMQPSSVGATGESGDADGSSSAKKTKSSSKGKVKSQKSQAAPSMA